MNITFLKLYITEELNSSFYNSQEIGLAKAITEVHPEHRVNIVLLSRGKSHVEEITDKVMLHVVKAKGIGHHGRLELDLLKELKTDLVHLLADNMMYAPNVIRYCKKNGIKYHLYIGTLFTDNTRWYRKAFDRLMMVRNVAAYRKSPMYVKTPAAQIQCRELGIDAKLAPVGLNNEDVILSEKSMDEIRAEHGIPLGKKVLLFVGRLESYKHPLDAVEVLKKLREREDYHLVVVGRGSLEDILKTKLSGYDLSESVTLLPKVPNTEMKHLYKACDYFVNFNPDEIYGMSILEAMAHNCPVFAIKAPGPEFLLKDGETGFICQSLDEMSERIRKCTSDAELSQIKSNARKHVISNLTWDKLVSKFEDF